MQRAKDQNNDISHLTKQGFTLSELLVSLSVLGLVAALTLPSIFNSVAKSKFNA
jgi:prepilin-type N-terminal cleavage/methylation domain-containing protein